MKLTEEEKKYDCRRCGKEMSNDTSICLKCKADLEEQEMINAYENNNENENE